MAFSNRLKSESFIASGDHSGLQYHIVEILAAHEVGAAVAGAGFGVLQNKPQNDEHATVAVEGITKVKAGAAISVGNYITSAGSGWASAVTSGGSTKKVVGRALTAAASGSVFSMEIDRFVSAATLAI